MPKIYLKQHYTKSSSSGITKSLFTIAPIAGAFTLPAFKFIDGMFNDGKTSTAGFENILENINPIKYDHNKDLSSRENLQHIGLGAFNLMLISQSIHSAKNLYTKYNQSTKKIIPVEINGIKTNIIAKGSLPISTYLSDISLIGGTVGYFAVDGFWSKVMLGAGGILGNIICKAVADDSTESVYSSAIGIAGVMNNSNINSNNNSNNTNINSNNHTTVINNHYNSSNKTSENRNQDAEDDNVDPVALLATAIGLIIVAYAGSYLVSDSTPGLYQYKFYNMYGNELPIDIEWHTDNSYSLYNHETGHEIELLG